MRKIIYLTTIILTFVFVTNYNPLYSQGCITEAGQMSNTLIEACGLDYVSSTVLTDSLGNPTHILDGNDGYEYYLHSSASNILGTIISHNTTGIFLFQQPMIYGVTYYISQVVGDNIGTPANHIVDMSDPCLSVALGTPVIWYENPIANAGPDKVICGEDTELEAINSNGTGIWLPGQAQILDWLDPNSPTHYGLTGTNDSVEYIWKVTIENNGFQCSSYDTAIIVFMIIPQADVFWHPGVSLDYICGNTETNNENIFIAMAPGISGSNTIFYWISDNAMFYPSIYETDPDSVIALTYGYHEFNWIIENHHQNYVCSDTSISIVINFVDILTSPVITNVTNATNPNGSIDLTVSGGYPPYSFSWSNGEITEDLLNLSEGSYIVTVIDDNGCFTIDSIQVQNSISITDLNYSDNSNTILFPNTPNPFSSMTEFSFYLPEKSNIKLSIYDIIGNEIDVLINEDLTKGEHKIIYSNKLPLGTYLYRLTTNKESITMKMIVVD